MTADLYTELTLNGNKEELFRMLKVLKTFESDNYERYNRGEYCCYLEDINFYSGKISSCYRLADTTDEEILAYLSKVRNELEVFGSGPWGAYCAASDIELFERLADASPDASFVGFIKGFALGADVYHKAELRDHLLHLSDTIVGFEEFTPAYTAYFTQKLPYAEFCKLFRVDEDLFSENHYKLFIGYIDEGFPRDVDAFNSLCKYTKIDTDGFKAALGTFNELDIEDYDSYRDHFTNYFEAEKRIYDPKTKQYIKL